MCLTNPFASINFSLKLQYSRREKAVSTFAKTIKKLTYCLNFSIILEHKICHLQLKARHFFTSSKADEGQSRAQRRSRVDLEEPFFFWLGRRSMLHSFDREKKAIFGLAFVTLAIMRQKNLDKKDYNKKTLY